jgi:hypothetical protein
MGKQKTTGGHVKSFAVLIVNLKLATVRAITKTGIMVRKTVVVQNTLPFRTITAFPSTAIACISSEYTR